MAIDLDDHKTDVHGFDSCSSCFSISSACRINNVNEDDHCQHLEDTVRLDSPLTEDRLGNFDVDTEVIVDSDCDDHRKNGPASECEQEEMVLDSEDEETNGSRIVVVTKSSAGSVIEEMTKTETLESTYTNGIHKQCLAGQGIPLTDLGNEQNFPKWDGNISELTSIQEPKDWTQADALGFVDHFVSINEVDLSQGIGYMKPFRKKSPVVPSVNGPQKLARKINLHTSFKGNGRFDWVDSKEMEYPTEEIRRAPKFGVCEGKGVSDPKEETRVGSQLASGLPAHSAKDGCEVKKVYETSAENELESTGKYPEDAAAVRDSFDIDDVGFDTQIAAEAIEALANAHPFGQSSINACPDIVKKVGNSQLSRTCAQTSVTDDISAKLNKHYGRKFTRRISSSSKKQCRNQMLDHELTKTGLAKRSTLFAETWLHSGSSANSNESLRVGPPQPIEHSKEGNPEESKISGNNIIQLKKMENNPLASPNIQFNGQFEKVSPLVQRTREQDSGVWLKTIDAQAKNRTEKMFGDMEHGIVVYRRKRSRLNSKSLRISKLHDSSEEDRKSNLASLSNSDMWNHPRGKRTRRNAQNDSTRNFDSHLPLNSRCRTKCEKSKNSAVPVGLDCKSLVVAEKDHNLISKSAELSRSECAKVSSKTSKNIASSNYKNKKRPHCKDVPKVPLLKELTNLGVPKNIPEFKWKELRRRKDIANIRILFSQHLDEDIVKHQKKVAARLGISIVSCSTDATHFVVDKFSRTKNMLEAIAHGKPVVTQLWLESCGEANCFIDERNYILRDSKKEKEFGFCMPVSLTRAIQRPLLKDRRVLVTPKIKPSKEMIMNLAKAVQGQLVEKVEISALKDKDVPEDLLILSCKEDHSICLPFLQKGATCYSSELLLNGIVTQKLDYKRYQLFTIDEIRQRS